MITTELIEIAIAGVDGHRVEVASVEPAEIATGAVSSVSQIVGELIQNAIGFSGPEQMVTINGVFDGDEYLISISDDGVGISEGMLAALNRILDSATPGVGDGGQALGITVVARLAARHGISVRLIPGVPGTTARISLPPTLVSAVPADDPPMIRSLRSHAIPVEEMAASDYASESEEQEALARFEREFRSRPDHLVSMSEAASSEAQSFLESVFAPLRGRSAGRDRPSSRTGAARTGVGAPDVAADTRPPVDREPQTSSTTLRSRVPGQNFSAVDDETSVASSEAAIDLRLALSSYATGRRNAKEPPRTDD